MTGKIKISQLPVTTSIAPNDLVLLVKNLGSDIYKNYVTSGSVYVLSNSGSLNDCTINGYNVQQLFDGVYTNYIENAIYATTSSASYGVVQIIPNGNFITVSSSIFKNSNYNVYSFVQISGSADYAKVSNIPLNQIVPNGTASYSSHSIYSVSASAASSSTTSITAGNFVTVDTNNNFLDSNFNINRLNTFRNRIINGDFRINQRNITSSINNGYSLDRWIISASGTPVTISQAVSTNTTFQNSLILIGTSGNTSATMSQRIESNNIYDLATNKVTLSCYAASSFISSVSYSLYYTNTTDNWSSLPTLITSSNWNINSFINRYSASVMLPSQSINGLQLNLSVNNFNTSLGTLEITGVQLESGSFVSPFERLPITTELELCQRYYYNIPSITLGGYASSQGQITYGFVPFPVTMRTIPIVSTVSSSVYFCTGSVINISSNGIQPVITSATSSYYSAQYGLNNFANAEL